MRLDLRMVAVVDDRETWVGDELGEAGPDELCRRLHPKLVGALRLYVGDAEVAHELAQDALVRVIERWDLVREMDRPEAWAYRVAFNLARSGFRRRVAERRAHARTGPDAAVAVAADPADVLAVRAAVAALPTRQREAVVLRWFADLPLAEVAEAMGLQTGTVKAHLHQALAALRAGGLVDPDHHGRDPDPDPPDRVRAAPAADRGALP